MCENLDDPCGLVVNEVIPKMYTNRLVIFLTLLLVYTIYYFDKNSLGWSHS